MDRRGMLTKAPVSAAFAKLCLDQGSARVHGTLSGAVECADIKRNEAQDSVLGLSLSSQMRRKAFGGY